MNSLRAMLLSVCLLFYIPIFAGDIAKISSKNGMVLLKSGKKISGELHFFYRSDLIKIKINANISKAFTSHQVDRFSFYDKCFDVERVFISVSKKDFNAPPHGFYEIISSGSLNVIGKLKFENKALKSIYINPRLKSHKVFVRRIITHDYFVTHINKLIPLKQHLKELCLKDEEVSGYIASNHLILGDIDDQLKIIAYYNEKSDNNDFFMQEFQMKSY